MRCPKTRRPLAAVLAMALLGTIVLSGCDLWVTPKPRPNPPTLPISTVPANTSFTATEQASIYSAVATYAVTTDFAGARSFPGATVYIYREVESLSPTKAAVVSASVQTAVAAAIQTPQLGVAWVDRPEQVPRDARSSVRNGMTLTMGTIKRIDVDTVNVRFSTYFTDLSMHQTTSVVKRQGQRWTVVGKTGSDIRS